MVQLLLKMGIFGASYLSTPNYVTTQISLTWFSSLVLNAQVNYGCVKLCKSHRLKAVRMGNLPIVILNVSVFQCLSSTYQ
jgi:hypothetical protein